MKVRIRKRPLKQKVKNKIKCLQKREGRESCSSSSSSHAGSKGACLESVWVLVHAVDEPSVASLSSSSLAPSGQDGVVDLLVGVRLAGYFLQRAAVTL